MLTKHIGWLAALAPIVAQASPTPKAEPVDSEIVDLLRRDGNVGQYAKFFPDCSADPSYATGTSQYADGTGKYVTSSCDNGLTTLAVKRFHCWTDLYVTSTQASYTDWQNSGQVIDCATTSTCAEAVVNLNSSCTTDSTTWDNQFGAAVQAQFPIWNKDTSITPSLTYNHNFGGSNDVQVCTTVSNTGTCTWNDQKCHAIWVAQRNIQVNGYLRRSCNTNRDGTNVPNSAQRSDGYYTVGMQDISFNMPDNRIIGCAASCGDLTYPDPIPGPDGPISIS